MHHLIDDFLEDYLIYVNEYLSHVRHTSERLSFSSESIRKREREKGKEQGGEYRNTH